MSRAVGSPIPDRNALAVANLALAGWAIRRWCPGVTSRHAIYADLLSAAFEALLIAASRWDPARGRFITFAACHLKGAVLSAAKRYAPWRGFPEADGEPLDAADPTPGPETLAEVRELPAMIRQALGCLSPRERRVIELVFIEGRSRNETACALGVSVEAVRQIEQRSLGKLRGDGTLLELG